MKGSTTDRVSESSRRVQAHTSGLEIARDSVAARALTKLKSKCALIWFLSGESRVESTSKPIQVVG